MSLSETLGWLADLFAQHLYRAGVPLPMRRRWNLSTQFVATDDTANERVNVSIAVVGSGVSGAVPAPTVPSVLISQDGSSVEWSPALEIDGDDVDVVAVGSVGIGAGPLVSMRANRITLFADTSDIELRAAGDISYPETMTTVTHRHEARTSDAATGGTNRVAMNAFASAVTNTSGGDITDTTGAPTPATTGRPGRHRIELGNVARYEQREFATVDTAAVTPVTLWSAALTTGGIYAVRVVIGESHSDLGGRVIECLACNLSGSAIILAQVETLSGDTDADDTAYVFAAASGSINITVTPGSTATSTHTAFVTITRVQ